MNTTTYSDTFFKSSDIRECRFFIQTLKAKNIQLKTVHDTTTWNSNPIVVYDEKRLIDIQKIVNDTIFLEYKNEKLICDFINETRKLMLNSLVSTELINSLFSNDRILFYTWAYLQTLTVQLNISYKNRSIIVRNLNHIESNFISNSNVLMAESITSTLDSMSGKKIEKETLLYEINERYTTTASIYRNAFKWVQKKDNEECERILKHLIREIRNNYSDIAWNIAAINVCQKISVHNPYIAIYTLFYIWLASDSSKDRFIQKTYKSWSQNEYRKSDKKNITISISQASIDSLKFMRHVQRKSKDEIIDELIAKANDYSTL